jgi:hypothetical protein
VSILNGRGVLAQCDQCSKLHFPLGDTRLSWANEEQAIRTAVADGWQHTFEHHESVLLGPPVVELPDGRIVPTGGPAPTFREDAFTCPNCQHTA